METKTPRTSKRRMDLEYTREITYNNFLTGCFNAKRNDTFYGLFENSVYRVNHRFLIWL